MIDGVRNWLRMATSLDEKSNGKDAPAGYAGTVIDRLHHQNLTLQEQGSVKDERIEKYQGDIVRLRMLLRDIWSDLDYSARRSGLMNWRPAELSRGTAEKLIALHGRFGQGRKQNV